jgi:serine/threonine protein phosphatase PrpC
LLDSIELQYWAATDVGRQRDHNEDNFLIDKKLQLFIVADGMGGHASGEVASSLAVHKVREAVVGARELVERAQRDADSIPRQELLSLLENAIHNACAYIYGRAQQEADKRGMGTTCSVLWVVGQRGFIAHVGDSRIYLVRGGEAHQLTEDHSLINELVRRGKLKREEIDDSPYKDYKNAVTRAVGVYETVEPDMFDFDILPGDQFVMCSDGLSYYVDAQQLPDLCSDADVTKVPARLIELANERGGHDNITAVLLRVPRATDGIDRRAAELNLKLETLRRMPLFRYLTYKELVRVLNITKVKEYVAGQQVILENTPGDEMFVLLEGAIRLHKGPTFLTTLGPGSHFGEMALVDRVPRSASATAEQPTRVLTIDRKAFYHVVKNEPALSVKLLWSFVQVLTDRLRKTTMELSESRLEAVAEDLSRDVQPLFDEPSS